MEDEKCINCQILGFQRAINIALEENTKIATVLCSRLNEVILNSEKFRHNHTSMLGIIMKTDGNLKCILIPHTKP